jgi:glucose/mannose-6-phosphate isomerase
LTEGPWDDDAFDGAFEDSAFEPDGFALAADRLDMPDVIEAADPSGMLRQVASAAAQVRTALRASAEAGLPGFSADTRPRAVVVAGMGGSGTAGEITAAMCGERSPVQVVALRSAQLPGWVGAADVVIAVSCSGRTAETLSVATEAARRGCTLAAVGAEGSPLHRIAEQARAPFIRVEQAGAVLPRQALWALTVPVLVIAERLGLTGIGDEVYEQAARRLEEVSHQCRPSSEAFVNPGKSLALDLAGAMPLIWGTSALGAAAAGRFAAQLNENAKYPAMAGAFPEVAHNQLALFDGPFAASGDEGAQATAAGVTPLRLVLIADPGAREPAAINELAAARGVAVSELAMDAEHPLVRLATVIQLTDYASVYLGIASGIDPGQSTPIRDMPARIE